MASQGRCAAAPQPHGLGWELVRSYDFVSQGSLTIPLLQVCLGTGILTSPPLLLQECHAKHEPAHPQLQTLQGVVVNSGVKLVLRGHSSHSFSSSVHLLQVWHLVILEPPCLPVTSSQILVTRRFSQGACQSVHAGAAAPEGQNQQESASFKSTLWGFPVVKTAFPMQGAWGWSLVRELDATWSN